MIPKFRGAIETKKGWILLDSWNADFTFLREYLQAWQGMCKFKVAYKHVMQSTGLKDKNGVEIFAGDIVRIKYTVYSDFENFEVKQFRGGAWRIDNRYRGTELWLRNEECEIIGNIYQNPDLLKQEG